MKNYSEFLLMLENKGDLNLYSFLVNVEDTIKNDEDLYNRYRQICGKYLAKYEEVEDIEVNSIVDIKNALNCIDEIDKHLLKKELNREILNQHITENTDSNSDNLTLGGKYGFTSFLKAIKALNIPDIQADNDKCPSNFALIYNIGKLNKEKLIRVLSRFKSLEYATKIAEKEDTLKNIGVYFGLKYDTNFYLEYGILLDNSKRLVCGEFKVTKSKFDKLLNTNKSVLKNFQTILKDVTIPQLKTLMVVKNDLKEFSPGYYHKKTSSKINGDVLTTAYYGVGTWENGIMSQEEFDNIKEEFNQWILSKKWKDKVKFSVKSHKFWVYFKIKAK